MPRSRRNVVRRRLANGEVKEYRYAGAARIEAERQRTMADLIEAYKASSYWTRLSPNTQRIYRHAFKRIDNLRPIPVSMIGPEHIEDIREGLSDRPGMANLTLALLQSIFKVGRKRKWIASNPVTEIERFDTGEGGPWPMWAIERFRQHATAEWVFRMDLALLTVQRRGDLVKARWSSYDGSGIEFIQEKTGSVVYLPVPQLVEALNARRKAAKGLTIVADRLGRPISPKSFTNAWNTEMKRVGLHGKGLKFHGLRHTGLTWMAERGATEHQLAAASGHQSLAMVRRYTQHANQRQMASAAVSLLPTLAKRQNEQK